MRSLALLSLSVLLTWVAAAPAAAGSQPPTAVLIATGGRQMGRPYTWTRTSPAGEGLCSVLHADGFLSFAKAVRHDSQAKARIRFKKSRKPDDVDIAAWRRLDRRGHPLGRARRIPFRLHRRVARGELVAWDAIFRVRDRGHYYFDVTAEWDPPAACRAVSASWTFHLKSVT